jgi:hypothetical protein
MRFVSFGCFNAGCTGIVTTIPLGFGLALASPVFCLAGCAGFASLSEGKRDAKISAKGLLPRCEAPDALRPCDEVPDAGGMEVVGEGAAAAGCEEITYCEDALDRPTPPCLFHKGLQADRARENVKKMTSEHNRTRNFDARACAIRFS